jgi:hypothetical protein
MIDGSIMAARRDRNFSPAAAEPSGAEPALGWACGIASRAGGQRQTFCIGGSSARTLCAGLRIRRYTTAQYSTRVVYTIANIFNS